MALSLGILVGFQFLFPQKSPDQPAPGQSAQTATLDGQAPPVVAGDPSAPPTQPGTAPVDTASTEPGTPVDVQTSLYRVRIQPRGGRLTGFELTKYNKSPEPGSGPYDLIHTSGAAPL